MLFIDNQTVQQILTIDDAINSQDVAFRGLVDGAAIHRPRIDMYVPTGREDDYYRWGTMEGASRDLGVFAIRMKSDVVSWPETRTATGRRRSTASSPARTAGSSSCSVPLTANRSPSSTTANSSTCASVRAEGSAHATSHARTRAS